MLQDQLLDLDICSFSIDVKHSIMDPKNELKHSLVAPMSRADDDDEELYW